MIHVDKFEWISKGDSNENICTICERINGPCIVDELQIHDSDFCEIDCGSRKYGSMQSYPFKMVI